MKFNKTLKVSGTLRFKSPEFMRAYLEMEGVLEI
jgi:hypothetical protein